MHLDVSCAYLCEYLYVLFADTAQIKQCISVQYHPKNTYRYAHAGPLMNIVLLCGTFNPYATIHTMMQKVVNGVIFGAPDVENK